MRWLIAVGLLIFSGCGAGNDSPNLRSGPGRVAGDVVFSAPLIELRTAAEQPSPIAVSTLYAPIDLALFAPGEQYHTRSLFSQLWLSGYTDSYMQLDYSGGGEYRLPFDFTQVPLGAYTLGYSHNIGGDWDIPTVLVFDTQEPIMLSRAVPERTGIEHAIPGSGAAGGAVIRGKLLVSGNPVSGVPAPAIGAADQPQHVIPNYEGPRPIESQLFFGETEPSLFGRYFFTVRDLAPGSYKFWNWHSLPGQFESYYWLEDEDSDETTIGWHPLQVDATAGDNAGLVAYAYRQWNTEWPDGDKTRHQEHYGALDVTLRLPASFDWSADTILVAESTGSDKSANNLVYNYVRPEQTSSDNAIHFRLVYLRAGEYAVTLRQLGPANTDPVAIVATYPDLVQLPSGTPYPDFTWDGDGVPYAAIDFVVEQPARS